MSKQIGPLGWTAAVCLLIALAGCGAAEHADHGNQTDHADAEPAPAAVPAEPLEITPEMATVLARADLADGVDDKVVSRCAGCGLAMDGNAEHAMQAGEYEMHFCADSCMHRFREKADEAILALAAAEDVGDVATP